MHSFFSYLRPATCSSQIGISHGNDQTEPPRHRIGSATALGRVILRPALALANPLVGVVGAGIFARSLALAFTDDLAAGPALLWRALRRSGLVGRIQVVGARRCCVIDPSPIRRIGRQT